MDYFIHCIWQSWYLLFRLDLTFCLLLLQNFRTEPIQENDHEKERHTKTVELNGRINFILNKFIINVQRKSDHYHSRY